MAACGQKVSEIKIESNDDAILLSGFL